MKFGEFMAKLQQGEPKHIYLLAGEEHYYIDKAQERIFGQLFSNEQELNDSLQKINGDIDADDLINRIKNFTELDEPPKKVESPLAWVSELT